MIIDEARGELVAVTDRGLITLGKLFVAWDFLREALIPGGRQGTWHQRLLTDVQRERLDAQAFRERAYKVHNRRVGLSALAPQAAAAQVNVVDARAELQTVLADLAGELYGTARGRVLPPTPDPAARAHTIPCRDCDSSPLWRMLPGPDGRYSRCEGRCPVCQSPAACGCLPADARIGQALNIITRLLPTVRSADQARSITRELERLERLANAAAGVDPQRHILIRVVCPACRERGLELTAGSMQQSTWAITCTNKNCTCTGPGCLCGRTSTYRGGEHLWMATGDGWLQLNAALDAQSRTHLAAQLPTGTP